MDLIGSRAKNNERGCLDPQTSPSRCGYPCHRLNGFVPALHQSRAVDVAEGIVPQFLVEGGKNFAEDEKLLIAPHDGLENCTLNARTQDT